MNLCQIWTLYALVSLLHSTVTSAAAAAAAAVSPLSRNSNAYLSRKHTDNNCLKPLKFRHNQQ